MTLKHTGLRLPVPAVHFGWHARWSCFSACSSGRLISLFRPARGPEEYKAQVVTDLDIFTAGDVSARCEPYNIRAIAVRCRLNQIFSRNTQAKTSDFSQFFTASGEYIPSACFQTRYRLPRCAAKLTSSSSSAVRRCFSLLLSAGC